MMVNIDSGFLKMSEAVEAMRRVSGTLVLPSQGYVGTPFYKGATIYDDGSYVEDGGAAFRASVAKRGARCPYCAGPAFATRTCPGCGAT